eukprot:6184372-Pleurochrysis_carterae.AAC.4
MCLVGTVPSGCTETRDATGACSMGPCCVSWRQNARAEQRSPKLSRSHTDLRKATCREDARAHEGARDAFACGQAGVKRLEKVRKAKPWRQLKEQRWRTKCRAGNVGGEGACARQKG